MVQMIDTSRVAFSSTEQNSVTAWSEVSKSAHAPSKIKITDAPYCDAISMILPTFRRPEGLKRALESLKTQSYADKALEIIVADNDPDASAKPYVEAFAQDCNIPIIYIHAPNPGVANARNAAVEAASGRYLAFLDDDQFASETWLLELMKVMHDHDTGIAFCPTLAHSPSHVTFKPQCLDFFTRNISIAEDGIVDSFFGCGNSLLDREKCALPNPPFSPHTNETGGEDDLLFSQLKAQGVKNAWTHKTHAGENIEDWRMTHAYIRVRSFAYGQGPSRICADPDNFDIKGLLRWSVIGAAQFCIFTPLALAAKVIRHKSYIKFMRKAAEGAGKVFWYERFRPKIYGATALKAKLEREHDAVQFVKHPNSKTG